MNVMGIMQQIMSNNRVMGNPMIQNAMSMAQSGNGKGIEQMARNLCKEKGIMAMHMAVVAIPAVVAKTK